MLYNLDGVMSEPIAITVLSSETRIWPSSAKRKKRTLSLFKVRFNEKDLKIIHFVLIIGIIV